MLILLALTALDDGIPEVSLHITRAVDELPFTGWADVMLGCIEGIDANAFRVLPEITLLAADHHPVGFLDVAEAFNA